MFMSKKQNNRKVLALDFGSKRIGVAIGSTDFKVAFPRNLILHHGQKNVLDAIHTIVQADHIDLILLGLPVGMQGQSSDQEKTIRAFYDDLRKEVTVPVQLVDERLTTKIAQQKMSSVGLNGKQQRANKDSFAAAILLETFFQQL